MKKRIEKLIIYLISIFFNLKLVKLLLEAKLKENKTFRFAEKNMNYFFHSYNNFRLTERTVEIPIVKYFLSKRNPGSTLEIGNVTKHYYGEFMHFNKKDTLDKYESAYDVINLDIKDYKPDVTYNFIYSISTFEHMDSDGGRNPEYDIAQKGKFKSVAFNNINYVINEMLEKDGEFLLTFPLGYCNKEIDESLRAKEYENFETKNIEMFLLQKVSYVKWLQIPFDMNNLHAKSKNLPGVNFLCILLITK